MLDKLLASSLILLSVFSSNAQDIEKNLFKNPFFAAPVENSAPSEWEHRTKDMGFVKCMREDGTSFVRIGVNEEGEDSFIQQWVEFPPGTAQLRFSVKYRYQGVVAGGKGYRRCKIQGRWRKNGAEGGPWIEIGTHDGTSEGWIEKSLTVDVTENATAAYLRFALYKVKAGVLDVAFASCEAISNEKLAALIAEQENLAALERIRYRPEEPFGSPVSDKRFARLKTGININNWFGQP